MNNSKHTPVLLSEAVDGLNIRKGFSYVDATVGQGGHTAEIMHRMNEANGSTTHPNGARHGSKPALVLIDKDKEGLDEIRKRFSVCSFCAFHHGSFSQLNQFVPAKDKIGGILLDLGISSAQLDNAERGFSFTHGGPLDMRMNRQGITAAEIVNESDQEVIVEILRRYGEERFAARIVDRIIKERKIRPIVSTTQLAKIVEGSIPKKFQTRIHPATKTFQALRIAVNDELKELERGLQSALYALAPTGRLAVISFHSLEDRIVKQFFKANERECVCPPLQPVCSCGRNEHLKIISKKPIVPQASEIANNPRSRSAKLRIAEKRVREASRTTSRRNA